jgi:hypothetical protein
MRWQRVITIGQTDSIRTDEATFHLTPDERTKP